MSAQINREEIYNLNDSWEDFICDILNPSLRDTENSFIEDSILKFNRFVDADYALVGLISENGKQINSVAVCDRTKLLTPYTFDLEDTPCEEIIKNGHLLFEKGIESSFPKAGTLHSVGIKSYYGVPLYNSKKDIIGVLAIYYCSPKVSSKATKTLLYTLSSRISSELEHIERENELKRKNLELLVFKEELIHKNQKLDQINKELHEVSAKAEESNKLKSSFLANLSHEIRTPMNAIIGFTELLRSNNISSSEKDEFLNIIYQNGNQLMRVMDGLLDISKLQAKTTADSKEILSINELLNSIKKQYKEEINICQKNIDFQIYQGATSGADKLYTYKEAFLKIMDHLLENAIKFTPSGAITVGYDIYDDYFEFFVEDTGVGIPNGEEQNIFDMFRQADLNKTREFGGTGIGLSIVAKYIELIGGKVWAEPNRENGALFKFQIPVEL